jgi:hypothetical protein
MLERRVVREPADLVRDFSGLDCVAEGWTMSALSVHQILVAQYAELVQGVIPVQ